MQLQQQHVGRQSERLLHAQSFSLSQPMIIPGFFQPLFLVANVDLKLPEETMGRGRQRVLLHMHALHVEYETSIVPS